MAIHDRAGMGGGAAAGKIFIADDDRGLLRLIAKALEREGFATATAASGQEALAWLAQNRAELMLLDLKLPDVEGGDLIERLRAAGRCPAFIIITGQGDERVAVEMMKRGALDYLVKDVDFLQFVPAVVKRALEQLDRERRLAEAEEQVHLVRSVVDQGFSAVLITDSELPDPRIVYINPAFARMTGYAAAKVIGHRLSALASLTSVQERLRAGLPKGERFLEMVSSYQTGEGERWGEWRLGPVSDKSGKSAHWLIIFRDITERKRLEKELLEISDREKQRIGQDLHDGLCQHLAGIELMSQVLEQKLAGKSKADAGRAGEIARLVRDAISQTRQVARGLSPVNLEAGGLQAALEELAANTEQRFGVTCDFVCQPPVRAADSARATHLYRIAQEAVANALRHGKASRIAVQLKAAAGHLWLSVADNGHGMPRPLPPHKGMGLRIMQYRASLMGGSLRLEPEPGGGTRVVCAIPIEDGPKGQRGT